MCGTHAEDALQTELTDKEGGEIMRCFVSTWMNWYNRIRYAIDVMRDVRVIDIFTMSDSCPYNNTAKSNAESRTDMNAIDKKSMRFHTASTGE